LRIGVGHASGSDGGSFVEGAAALIAKDLRINDMIRVREVRVIDDEGQQLGVLPTTEALALAQEKGLDLVEVAPAAVPPVCRILDYGQYKYELQKREREAKRKQKSQTFKEIRLRVKIDVNDLRTKTRRAGEFLDEGDRVKVTVQFRGREMSHANLGRDLLDRAAEMLAQHGVVERPPLLEGRNMFIVMAPPEKRLEKKNDKAEATNGVITARGANGETIGDVLVATGLTVEPEPTEQIQHAEDEEPQGNGQAV
jgi:translation initiation factor IF-3